MKLLLTYSSALILLLGSHFAGAQGMAVNNTGAAAAGSAMLDVSSTSKGMLAPRMTSTQRAAISSPATGLLVYQTDAPAGFYVYDGAAWQIMSTGSFSNKYMIPLASISPVSLTTTSTGAQDSVALVGTGAGRNQWVNINAGSYIDPSGTEPEAGIPVPFSGTITSLSVYFKIASTTTTFFTFYASSYTLEAKLYLYPPLGGTLLGTVPYYPVPGASVSLNLSTACGGICIYSETLTASVTGLSAAVTAGSRLLLVVDYFTGSSPSTLQKLTGYVTAGVGMQ